MKIVIAGGTGFLGTPLAAALVDDGHAVAVLSRRAHARTADGARVVAWDPAAEDGAWTREVDGADVVINLAGEPIAAHRWTAAWKRRIEDSRVVATRRLAQAIAEAHSPPSLLVSQSGVNFYGSCGDELVTEETGAGHDFLATVCRRWEAQAVEASSPRTRVVCMRTGLVLSADGGALAKMLPPFRFGFGGPLGTGKQYWPWIHRRDWIDLIRFVVDVPSLAGALNATAPNPVPNAEFARELGRVLRRTAFIRTPRLALRIALGEMADALLLSGQRAIPAKAERSGFTFSYPTLAPALEAVLQTKR
jgi:uncharacterized protein (TIGR01777 family)